jgi:hypothetical protein
VQRQPAGDNFPPLPANIIYNKKNISVQLLRHKIQRLLNPHAQPSQMYGRNVNACKQNPASSLLPFSLRKKHLKSPTRQHFSLPPPPQTTILSQNSKRETEKQRHRDRETQRGSYEACLVPGNSVRSLYRHCQISKSSKTGDPFSR